MTAVPRPANAISVLGRVARYGFVICAFSAGALLVMREQDRIVAALAQTGFLSFALALTLGIGHAAMAFIAWHILLRDRDSKPAFRATARMFFLGQIGKYLPGGIWSFVGVAELGRDCGFERRTTIASQMLAMLVCLGMGAAIGLATVPQAIGLYPANAMNWVIPAALPLAALLHPAVRRILARLAGLDFAPSLMSLALCAAMMAVLWTFAGAQLIVLCGAVGTNIGWQALPVATGIYAVSWTVGFLFLIAPAGLGAREATLVALLSTYMPLPQAVVVAFLSRIAMTLADFLLAAAVGLMTRAPAAR